MATAVYVADRALRLILVQASDSPLEPDEYEDFYNSMNDFMADLEAQGTVLGYTPVSLPSDEITIPSGALRGLIANMAVESAPDFGKQVDPVLLLQAQQGLKTMRRMARANMQTSYPVNLPMGSGNNLDDYQYRAFYERSVNVEMTLTNNTLPTVIATVDTPVLARGLWSIVDSSGLSSNINGRITNTLDNTVTFTIKAIIEVTGGTDFTAHFYENGNLSIASVSGPADGSVITLSTSASLMPNEYLELWIENDTDDGNLVLRDANVRVG